MFSLFPHTVVVVEGLCGNNEGDTFAGASLVVGAHLFIFANGRKAKNEDESKA